MKYPFTGGCVCGEVRYECASRPLIMLNCHCRDCQRISGGPYTPVVVVPLKAFKITKGEIKHYATPSLSGGHNLRGFCPNCGSRLTGAEDAERGSIGITASSLDDPRGFKARMDLFVGDAQGWDLLDQSLPKHHQYAPTK